LVSARTAMRRCAPLCRSAGSSMMSPPDSHPGGPPGHERTAMNRHFLLIMFAAAGLLFAADGADWIERLGGTVKRDTANRIVAVNLRGSWINDGEEMTRLAELPALEALDLSHTRITDEGLLRLKPAPKIRDLSLFYAEWLTDQGMSAIRDWKHLKRLNLRGTRISDGTLELIGRITGL